MGCGVADIWFSSDHHFHHENIIKYANRPFSTVAEMNEMLVKLHNDRVRPSDHWYCLGDVTMERDNQGRGLGILRRMNGHKRLILGNHDHYQMKHYLEYFEKVMAMQRIDDLWLMHVPCHPSNVGSSKAIVHGHIHANPSPATVVNEFEYGGVKKRRVTPYINISVEAINYAPVTIEWLRQEAARLKEGV